ncbi:MAG: carbohydrate ABC transporter permease [Chloroflexi bacterium]|nr:carbohydrate ABC transporter permease [Chloroflexota bacterium]
MKTITVSRQAPPTYRTFLRVLSIYLLLTVIAIIFLSPIFWMLKTALTRTGDLFLMPIRIIPNPMVFTNFQTIWHNYPFPRFYLNSFQVAILATIGQLLSCSFTAFALTNLKFPGRNLLLIIILGTMMIPFQVIMVPLFILMSKLGWLDTLLPLWVPPFFGGITGAFGIFLLRQAFLAVPRELIEAAAIDGGNLFDLYWRICLPLAKPHLAVLGVFAFMTSWNDFLGPIIFITHTDTMTVTGGLSFFQAQWHVYWSELMAGTFLAMIPTLIIYIFSQRFFIETIATTGLKG